MFTCIYVHPTAVNKAKEGWARPSSHLPVSEKVGLCSWVAFALLLIWTRKCSRLGNWMITFQKLKSPCSPSSGNVKMLQHLNSVCCCLYVGESVACGRSPEKQMSG